jgi:flagellar motor switch protein FliG
MTTPAVALTGSRKVAALLIALGTEASAKVLARLPHDAVDRIALELMRMPALEADVRDAILQETYTGVFSQLGALPGGESYARTLFTEAFGEGTATEVIGRAWRSQPVAHFDFLGSADPVQVKELLAGEHPQTIALVLAHLEPRQAARILVELEPDLQVEVARRVALTEQTTPDTLAVVEDAIRRRISAVVSDVAQVGGARPLAHVLNQVGRSTERQILGSLAERDAELADEVRRFMFVFEDIAVIDDRAMQRIIRDLDTKDIAFALRTATEDVKHRFFGNMSQRAAEMLREEMSLTTGVRIKNVEEAQGRIVEVIKRLEDEDEIVISRGGADDVLV